MTSITHIRHFDARVHQTFTAEVPDEVLANPLYFTPDGEPTMDFDQWMCDNGRLKDEKVEAKEEWQLDFASEGLPRVDDEGADTERANEEFERLRRIPSDGDGDD